MIKIIQSSLILFIMAEFNSYLLGKVRKSVGNITLCYTRQKNIAKAKVFTRKDNPTPEILQQRAKLKILSQLSRGLLPVVKKGFAGIGKGSTSNAFVATNMKAVVVDEKYAATVNFEQLLVANGIINPPKVTVTFSAEKSSYVFEQTEQEEEDGFALADDKVYGVLFETERGRARLVALKSRGESGTTEYPLPDEWDNSKVKAYCFATLKSGKRASDSLLIL